MDTSIKNLGAAIILQAVKDYFNATASYQKRVIINDLKSDWLDFITNGTSIVVADKLKSNPEEIRRRLGGINNA
jgi:hypothetical protein